MANPENKQIPYESTQKDIRDAIESVATAIGGIAIPSADHVSYDNSGSGLSATDVQNALDEIVSDIPTVNNGTLTIQQNGTSIGSFSANTASNVTTNIKTPTADKKTATSEFSTANGGLLSKCQINLEPVQSGSGDPYPAGGGKNKYSVLVGDDTFTDNVSGTSHSDSNGQLVINMVGSTNSGCYSANGSTFKSVTGGLSGTYTISCDIKASTNMNIRFRVSSSGTDLVDFTATTSWQRKSITLALDSTERMLIFYNQSSTSGTITVKDVQIESGSTATPYAPYSNVRPISGHTEVDLYNVGKNKLPLVLADIKSANTSGTWSGNAYTLNGIKFTTLTDGDGNITGISINGLSTAVTTFMLTIDLINLQFSQNTILSGYDGYGWNSAYLQALDTDSANYTTAEGEVTIPSSKTIRYVRIRVPASFTANNILFYPMIRLASDTDSTFEPYLGHLYQVQIGSTVYGGYVDLVSGVMISEYAIEDLGNLNWSYSSLYGMYTAGIQSTSKHPLSNTDVAELVCSSYKTTDWTSVVGGGSGKNTCGMNTTGAFGISTTYTDPSAFKTFVTGQKVCYKLATPTTINLTPQQIETLVGQNNLSTPLDGQSIETNGVEYKELFTWDDVQSLINNDYASSNTTYSSSFIETKFALKYDLPLISSKVVKASGSTSVTFNHERIFSADQTYCELLQYGSGDRVVVSDVSVTTGSVTFTFASATTQSITFRCRISNVLIG